MNIDDCAMSISSDVSSSLPASNPEPILQTGPELNIPSKILKAKSIDSISFDNTCSPAKKSRLEDHITNLPTGSGVSSCSQENEAVCFAESSTFSSSLDCSNNISSLFKNVQAQHNKPLKNNDIHNPRQLLRHLVPSLDMSKIPPNLDDFDICRLVYKIMSSQNTSDSKQIDLENLDLPSSSVALNHASAISSLFLTHREKLTNVNTIEDCVELIYKSKNIIVLTGAGCSVSCGIPDFRSRDGIYARLRIDFPDLPDPQSMFDIFYFEHDPRPFFKFAKEIFPGQFKPSLSHMFIKNLDQSGRLLRNYTQNIDTLELVAEIKNVIQCHGSFATATCTLCKYKVNSEFIKDKIFQQEIPYCDKCSKKGYSSNGILKPDIVFFGEGLPEEYHNSINIDKNKCDLLIVIGSSLKVKPVANIPHLLPKEIPQILINRESLKHLNFDVELLGDCDIITNELLIRLNQRQAFQHNFSFNYKKILLNKIEDEEADKFIFHSTNQSETNDSIELSRNSKVINNDYLKENSFLYLKPNVYVFHGAEVSVKSMRKKLERLRNLLNGDFKEELDEDDFESEEEFSTENETDEDADEEEDDSEKDDDSDKDDENNDAIYKPILNAIINEDEYDEENDEDFKINDNDSSKEGKKN